MNYTFIVVPILNSPSALTKQRRREPPKEAITAFRSKQLRDVEMDLH